MAIEVRPSRVPQVGPSPRMAMAVALVVLVTVVGFALLGRSSEAPTPPSAGRAALAAPSSTAPSPMPRLSPVPSEEAGGWSPAPVCVTPWVITLSSPIERHPRPLMPTGFETVAPWTGAEGDLVADAETGFWASGAGRLTRLDAAGRITASWTFADDPIFGSWGLAPARGGGVWLWGGTEIAWFDGQRLRDVIAAPTSGPDSWWVADVAEAPDGTLWAAANGGPSGGEGRAFHWDGQDWIAVCGHGTGGQISHVAVDPAGGVWATPNEATEPVSHFDGSAWSILPVNAEYLDDPARPTGGIGRLIPVGRGSFWMAAGGLAFFDGKTWTAIASKATDLSGTVSLAVAPDGDVWAVTGSVKLPGQEDASQTGIVLARLAGGSWTVYGAAQGLPDPHLSSGATITAVAASRDAVVAATRDGFYRLVGERLIRTGAQPSAQAPSWPDLLLAESSDSAWAAGWDGGLWHVRDGTWTNVPVARWKAPVRVFALARGPDGSLALATDHGTAVLSNGSWAVLGEAEAEAVTFARDGTIWVAERTQSDAGAAVASFRFDGRAWVRIDLPILDLPGVRPSVLALAPDGRPWLLSRGWGNVLDRFDGTGWVRESPLGGSSPSNVAGLAVAPDGELWAVVAEGDPPDWSVAHRVGASWTFDRASDTSAEPGYATGFAMAPDGRAWVSTDRGLASSNGRTWSRRFPGSSFITVSVAPDGTLWAIGPSGVGRLPAHPAKPGPTGR